MLPFAQLLTVRIGGVRIAGAAFEGPRRGAAPCPFSSTFHFKEISEWPARRKKNPNAPATASWMRPSTCSCPRGGQHHHGRHRRPRRRVQGAVYGHYKNKIDVCVAMSDRALAAAVALTRVRADGKALESLYASMLQYVRIYSEEGRCSVCWKSSTTSASRATRMRRCCDDGTSGNAMPCAIPKTAARRGAQRRPARRAGRAPVQRLPALLIEGCSAASVGPIA